MTFSGSTITFGIGTVMGTLVGAALASLSTGEAHWEGFDDLREMRQTISRLNLTKQIDAITDRRPPETSL